MDIGKDITQIAMTMAGIAMVALLLRKAPEAVSLIRAAGDAYNGLLRTVTLQGVSD